MATLALKLFLAPACVVAVSLAGRRWGARMAGLLGGFPVVGGPILLVVTLQHGDEFGAEAADAGVRLHHKRLSSNRLRAAVREATGKRAGAERVARAFAAAGGAPGAADAIEEILAPRPVRATAPV